jgi:hypothetical protein
MFSTAFSLGLHTKGVQHDLAAGRRTTFCNGSIDIRHDAGKAACWQRKQPPSPFMK